MRKFILLFILAIIAGPGMLQAGIHGILKGKVTDENGQGIMGASVRVEGTTRGAFVKSRDGSYFVANIVAGEYTVAYNSVGKNTIKKQVRIIADDSTIVNTVWNNSIILSNTQKDTSLSPYFYVSSGDTTLDCLPLQKTSANVVINGVIADVTIRQTYKNAGKKPIEAIFVFPGSTRAAVYAMTMRIEDRVIVAQIKEKEEARKVYDQAKKEGKSASLLEQSRPNVFTMNVANIMPGDVIEVEMKYTELLIPENKIYSFVYPTVVGPRYSGAPESKASADDKFSKSPYQHENEKPLYDFDIHTKLVTGVNLAKIESPSHKINVKKLSDFEAEILLDPSEAKSGNKDFVLNYTLTGDEIQTGLILNESGKEKYFLLMLQPPARVKPEQVPPREYIFIMDVSGSMGGYPLNISKSIMKKLLAGMGPDDRFNLLLFANGSEILSSSSLPVTDGNIEKATKLFGSQSGGGGTEIMPAVEKALSLDRIKDGSTSFVILTDGYITVESELFDLIRKNLGSANMFAFGIGSSVNRFLIDGIAHVGLSESFVAMNQKEGEVQAEKFAEYIKAPILTDIKVGFEGFDAYDIEPLSYPDLLADRPLLIYGKYRGHASGTIKVSGKTGNENLMVEIPVSLFARPDTSSALKYLWARKKLQMISDYAGISRGKNYKDEIIKIGLDYSLLTQYTSFVAVDSKVRNGGDSAVVINQPLPLPEGVSDGALGYIGMSAGVSPSGNSFNIRGSRSSGTQFKADGADVNSPKLGETTGSSSGESLEDPLVPMVRKKNIFRRFGEWIGLVSSDEAANRNHYQSYTPAKYYTEVFVPGTDEKTIDAQDNNIGLNLSITSEMKFKTGATVVYSLTFDSLGIFYDVKVIKSEDKALEVMATNYLRRTYKNYSYASFKLKTAPIFQFVIWDGKSKIERYNKQVFTIVKIVMPQ